MTANRTVRLRQPSERRLVVEHARARGAQKRGGEWMPISLDPAADGLDCAEFELSNRDAAFAEATTLSRRQVQFVAMRHFAGLSLPDIAEALDVTASTDRDRHAAPASLRRRLQPA